jgi:hypothetical protein
MTDRLRKADWIVANADQAVAERMVVDHHYAKGTSNTAVHIHGLYPRIWHWYEDCVGVAWWIPPTRSAAEKWAGGRWKGVLALSRLVILPDVPANACSFLLAGSVRRIDRQRWHTLVTYADSWRGHKGNIYRAANWEYCGETKPEAVYTLNGRMVSRKAGPRTRTHAEMLALGAVFEGKHQKARFMLRAA